MSVYQDIVASIIKDIKNGSLEKGSKLPSIRQLSQTLSLIHISEPTRH